MIIDSGWDFIAMARLRWGDGMGTASRQFLVLGDHHWWFYGTHDLIRDPRTELDAWTEEVLTHADQDYVRYIAVVMEVPYARLDYSADAYPFDRELTRRAADRGLHHMGCYFIDADGWWCATGPAKTFSTYVGAEHYPTVVTTCADSYREARRVQEPTGSDGLAPTTPTTPHAQAGSTHA